MPHWPLESRKPFDWQLQAWHWLHERQCTGIIEAVSDTGKALIGIAMAGHAIAQGRKVLLLVPTVALQELWCAMVAQELPGARVGRLGGHAGISGLYAAVDILVAVVGSAAANAYSIRGYTAVIADECHRYGARTFRLALLEAADIRVGLTATLERSDVGVHDVISPYFGGERFEYSYSQGAVEGTLAPFVVGHVGVDLNGDEQEAFDSLSNRLTKLGNELTGRHGASSNPGRFMEDVITLAKGAFFLKSARSAKQYLKHIRDRIDLLATCSGRLALVDTLAPSIRLSSGTLVFTETIEMAGIAAGQLAANGISVRVYHSGLRDTEKADALEALKRRTVQALVSVKALDEGVDVPDVDLGIVLSASRQRRQMIQRLGWVVRRKSDGRHAAMLNVYAKGTHEDPAAGAHEGFTLQIQQGAIRVEDFGADDHGSVHGFLGSFLGRPGAGAVEQTGSSQPLPQARSGTGADSASDDHSEWEPESEGGWIADPEVTVPAIKREDTAADAQKFWEDRGVAPASGSMKAELVYAADSEIAWINDRKAPDGKTIDALFATYSSRPSFASYGGQFFVDLAERATTIDAKGRRQLLLRAAWLFHCADDPEQALRATGSGRSKSRMTGMSEEEAVEWSTMRATALLDAFESGNPRGRYLLAEAREFEQQALESGAKPSIRLAQVSRRIETLTLLSKTTG